MDAIEQARTSDPWVKAWAPLQCPSEIIFDLLNHFDEQRARAERPAAFLAWAVETFGPVAKLRSERLMRFVEEAIELAQAEGMELSTLDRIASRVYSQPAGSVSKEIAQAQVCLETLSEVLGESASALAEKEFERVRSIPREEWIRRHAAKQAIGIAEPAHG
ncbi:hypothetical protein [Bradyrhizobium ivorense]|uniref:hypothetical protein n=1 Tax=Bradyrhizobium ivorense TaxID=2511166 RepID=UPI0010B7B9E4|nr:hypothetical protein [Bradyrhizobium ivorense]VIO73842.1 hypothetical protein CI41S_39510 [Bradyrhizobium ivorense]